MIKVNYLGRTGNNMFQYAFGRILAEDLGIQFDASPIPGFRSTYQSIFGKSNVNSEQIIIDDDNYKLLFNQKEIIKDKFIIINGFFQYYDIYKPYKKKLRQWFKIPKYNTDAHEADVVIHIRLTDYMLMPEHWCLPLKYYTECIEQSNSRNIHIVTDEPNHPFLEGFKKYQPKIINSSSMKDFSYLASGKKIILSRSSFSFWAGFLSQAEEIYFPNPDKGHLSTGEQNLFVDDEDRYNLIEVKI